MGAMIDFGSDGWRARLDGDFTEENVVRIAAGAAEVWSRQARGAVVYVGYDARPAAERTARLAGRVLASFGLSVNVSDRVSPTPAVAWAVANDARACGGLMVTGGTSPNDYLGMKLRVADGGVGTQEFYEEVSHAIDQDPTEARGPIATRDFVTPYLDHLVSLVDGERIAEARLKLVCDPMYGAARGYVANVLRVMGVEVAEIHGRDDEATDSIHPEPIEPWVDECEQVVVATGAQAGVVVDGDGICAAAIDERGRYVCPQKIAALLMNHLVRNRGMEGRVVLNPSASVVALRAAEELERRVSVKPAGCSSLYRAMRKGDVLLAAEEAGGIGLPWDMPACDGLLVNLLLCELMAYAGKPLGVLVDELDKAFGTFYYSVREIRLEGEVVEMLRTLLPGLNPPVVADMVPVTVSHLDGLRLGFADSSWLLVRPDQVAPRVCIRAEATSPALRDALLAAGRSLARGDSPAPAYV